MKDRKNIIQLISNKILILDGATGTELQKKGMPAGVSPEIWTLENPDVQASIYRDYAQAGSDIIYTCTFGASSYKLSQFNRDDVEDINRQHAQLAVKASEGKALVAGDIGPIGRFIHPFGDLPFDEAVKSFKRQATGLFEGGVDLFVIETQMDIQEARAALIAVRELTDAFTLVTMTFEPDGRTLNGTPPEAALVTLQSLGADAFGCNCSTGPAEMLQITRQLKDISEIPLAAKPNAGMPVIDSSGKTVFPMGPEEFASYAALFADAGANLAGGCCGTSPIHIRELAKAMNSLEPCRPRYTPAAMLSSAREAVSFAPGGRLGIIGERINPTGKKKLQKELSEGRLSIVREMALEQEEKGAALLDINAGMPGIDEKQTVIDILSMLSQVSGIPLVIDSSNPDAVESFLRYYPGRALINSISGEKHKLDRLLPLAAKYGAMFILLPVTDKLLPETHGERAEIIKQIFTEAEKHGFRKKDIIIDGLVMTVSSGSTAAVETLNTIKWASANSFFSVIGLSNVSFGLPARHIINSSFLSMAVSCGLSHVIANPGDTALQGARYASDLLTGRDRDASGFIQFASSDNISDEKKSTRGSSSEKSAEELISEGIIRGIRDDIIPVLENALGKGIKPQEILEKTMIPAIIRVGELYEEKKMFLPQLVASAETMKNGVNLLQPRMGSDFSGDKGKILFATVEGDIHDIGKNIVVMMLRNSGFNVTDLGKDVSSMAIIKAASEHRPDIIALSALMTTTMVKIPEVIKLAAEKNIDSAFMAGGAVVTREWAESAGAEYSKDGVEAVRTAEKIVRKRKERTV